MGVHPWSCRRQHTWTRSAGTTSRRRSSGPSCVFDRPELRYPERLNCAATLLDDVAAERGPDRPCLRTDDGDLDLRRAAGAGQPGRARARRRRSAWCPGSRVLLRAPNNPWLVACWFAVLKAGGVVVTTVPLLRSGELQQLSSSPAAPSRCATPGSPPTSRRLPGLDRG